MRKQAVIAPDADPSRLNLRVYLPEEARPMKLSRFAVLAAAATLCTHAFAQLPVTRVLTMDVAQAIAQEAMAKCRADGYKVTVLVVDGLNAPKAMLRDDGATASTTEVA